MRKSSIASVLQTVRGGGQSEYGCIEISDPAGGTPHIRQPSYTACRQRIY